MLLVRDLAGKPLFYLEGDVVRDDAGKPLATRVGDDKTTQKLSDRAAVLMGDRKVLLDLAPGDVMTPATQAEFGIPDGDFVADKVSEVRYISKDRGVFYPENVTDALKLIQPVSSPDAAPMEINPGYSAVSFATTGYAAAVQIPRLTGSNADFDLRTRALRFVVNALRLTRELRVATLLTTTTNWPAANRVAVNKKWNTAASVTPDFTVNPLGDMFAALKASFIPATLIVMPESAAQYFYQNQNSQTVRDYVQSEGPMPEIVVGRAKYMVGGSPVYVWGPALPTHVPLVRSADSLPSTVTFRWIGDDGLHGQMSYGMLVREYFDSRSDSNWLVVAHNDAEVQVSNQVGALITGALA